MPDPKPIRGLFLMLLLGSCTSGQLARLLPSTDPRIDEAPMSAETKSYARSFFSRPNPKAFAFSPEKGTAWAAWGSSSEEGAKEFALRECEARTRTPCVLFAVDNEIVWRPEIGQPTAAGARESKPRATNVAPSPVAEAPPAIDLGRATAAAPETPPRAARVAIHVASVRNPAEVPGEWQRLTARYRVLAGLEPQAPIKVDVPGKGVFYRIIGGAFETRSEAQAVCERLRSAGGYCMPVEL
jgi:SPOR domain